MKGLPQGILLASLVLLSVLTSTAQPARIKGGLWRAVVRIESIDTNGVTYTGSGFVVTKTIVRDNLKRPLQFLVTNKHVVGDWNLADGDFSRYYDSLRVFYYSSNRQPAVVKLKDGKGSLKWLVAPHGNPKVDVAVIALLDEFNSRDAEKAESFDVSLLLPFGSKNIGYCDQVFALGYPLGLTSLNNFYPLAKGGYVASMPGEEFKQRIRCQNHTNGFSEAEIEGKIFIIDGLMVPGNSGGPVIMPSDFKVWAENGELKYLTNPTDNFVIGICSQVVSGSLSVVFSSDYITELIESIDKRIININPDGFKIRTKD